MKKIICFVLALAMLLSVNVTVFAADKPTPVSVSFSSEEPLTVIENFNVEWSFDDDDDEYYYYSVEKALCQEGNSVTVTYSDDSTVVYTYSVIEEYDEEYDEYSYFEDFFDADENVLYYRIVDDQEYTHWQAGETYNITMFVGRATCEIPVTVQETPIASMRVITPGGEDISIDENTHGILDAIEYEDDNGETAYLPYYYYYEDEIICALGNKLEVTYKDESVVTYDAVANEMYIPIFDVTWVFYNFADEDGNTLDINLASAQDEEFWIAGEEYVITLTYMGAELEVPITINPASHWVDFEGDWYYIVDDVAVNGWVNDNGKWYYFDDEFIMQTGWINDGGIWYYLKSNGAMATGWQKISGVWYYFKSSGAMATGWVKDGSKWYYLTSSGAMKTGWLNDSRSWYYLDSNGAMHTGWLLYKNNWYYLESNGKMLLTASKVINGKSYYFDNNGICENP